MRPVSPKARPRAGLERKREQRSLVLADTLSRTVEPLVENHSYRELQRQLDRFKDRQQLTGIAAYGMAGELLLISAGLAPRLDQNPAVIEKAEQDGLAHAIYMEARRESDARGGTSSPKRLRHHRSVGDLPRCYLH